MQNWQLFARVEALYASARLKCPVPAKCALLELANEGAGIELINLIAEICTKLPITVPRQNIRAVRAVNELIEAIEAYRMRRDWQARHTLDPIRNLVDRRDRDLPGLVCEILLEPERGRLFLADLLRGGDAAGTVCLGTDDHGQFTEIVHADGREKFRGYQDWVEALAFQPGAFRRTLEAAHSTRPKRRQHLDLVRRLRDLAGNPTRTRFGNLIKDARHADANMASTLDSTLRYAARRTLFQNKALPRSWIDQVTSPAAIEALAVAAHSLLKKTKSGQGRVRNHDFERYCQRVAAAYGNLTGKPIGYAKATATSKSHRAGHLYGVGLDFMILAMRMIDGAAGPHDAQREIDRIKTNSR